LYFGINIANIAKNENIENIPYFRARKYRIYIGYILPIYIMDIYIYRANPAPDSLAGLRRTLLLRGMGGDGRERTEGTAPLMQIPGSAPAC